MNKIFKKSLLSLNIVLTGIFVVLLTATYYLIEIKGQEKIKIDASKNSLMPSLQEIGELKRITGEHLDIIKTKNQFRFKSFQVPIELKKLDKFFYYLTHLKIKEELIISNLTLPLEQFVPNTMPSLSFEFDQANLEFKIGNKIKYSQDFYLMVKQNNFKEKSTSFVKLFIISDSAPREGAYLEENQEKSSDKYLRTKGLFLMPNNFFFDLHLISEEIGAKPLDIEKTVLKNYRSNGYTVDLKNKKTIPSALSSISYSQEVFDLYYKELLKVSGEDILMEFSPQFLKDKISDLQVYTPNKIFNFSLWRSYKKIMGPFVSIQGNNYLLKLKNDATAVFTIPLQAFWDKKLSQKVTRLSLLKSINKSQIDFLIENKNLENISTLLKYKDPMIEINSPRILKTKALDNLIYLITKDADYLSALDREELKKDWSKKDQLVLDGKTFFLQGHEDEWQAISLDQKLKWHYHKGPHPNLTLNLEEYLK